MQLLSLLVGLLATTVLAQNGNAIDSDAGALGSSSGSAMEIGTGGMVAIIVVIVIVVIFGTATTSLFVVAKRQQWTKRETVARVSRKVVDALPRTPGLPRTPRFPPTPGGRRAQMNSRRVTANAIRIADEPPRQANDKRGVMIDAKEVDVEKGQTPPALIGNGQVNTKKSGNAWMQRLWANAWK